MSSREFEPLIDLLRRLREEEVERELAEVRGRVMAGVEGRKPAWIWALRRRTALVPAIAAAVATLAVLGWYLPAPVPAPPGARVLPLVAPALAESRPKPLPLRAVAASTPLAVVPGTVSRPASQPQKSLLVKLFTDDPDVVIYWLIDSEGDPL